MKKTTTLFFLMALLLSSCGISLQKIGSVNSISVRNIDADNTVKYQKISSCVNCSDDEKKRSKATTVNQAIDQATKQYAGGEYLQNCNIYLVDKKYFAVDGDVFGIPIDSKSISTYFKIGQKIGFNKNGKPYEGSILKINGNIATIKYRKEEIEIPITDLKIL